MARGVIRAGVAFAIVLAIGGWANGLASEGDAAPRPPLGFGAHAEYEVIVIDEGGERAAKTERILVDLGPTATLAGPFGTPILASPLQFRFALDADTQVASTYWIANDAVVARTVAGAAQIAQDGLEFPATAQVASASQSIEWELVQWGPSEAPCGFLPAPPGNRCEVTFSSEHGWPVQVIAPLSDLLGSPGAGHASHRLDLALQARSLGPWPQAPMPAVPAVALHARSEKGPEAVLQPTAFTLDMALEALEKSPTDTAVRDLRARHSDAYVAYARHYQAMDVAGNRQSAWHVVWVGGSERIERAIVLDPPMHPLIPSSPVVIAPSALDYPVRPAPAVVPPASLAPATMPSTSSLADAYQVVGGRGATGWGFAIYCTLSCRHVETRVMVFEDQLEATQAGTARWQRNLERHDELTVDGDGRLSSWYTAEFGQPKPDLLASNPLSDQEGTKRAEQLIPLPTTERAAAIGIIGLLAAGLALAWPALKMYVPLFSRIESNRLLDHPVRRKVHDLVNEEPGIHASEVARRLDIAGNTAHHHLERLVLGGYLGERHIGSYHCYFPRGGLDERLQDAVPALKSSGAQAVLHTIAMQGAPSFRSIMAATGLGYATVHHHAQRLWRAGLLSSERDGKARRFKLTELGRRVASQAGTLGRFPKHPMNGSAMDGAT